MDCRDSKEEVIISMSMENFQETVENLGFVQAVLKLEDEGQLPTEVWGLLTIEECMELCLQIRFWDSDLRRKAFCRMDDFEEAANTDLWWKLYQRVDWHLELLDNKLRKMVKAKITKAKMVKAKYNS